MMARTKKKTESADAHMAGIGRFETQSVVDVFVGCVPNGMVRFGLAVRAEGDMQGHEEPAASIHMDLDVTAARNFVDAMERTIAMAERISLGANLHAPGRC